MGIGTAGLLISGLALCVSFYYKIRNKLWDLLIGNFVLILLAFMIYGWIQFNRRIYVDLGPKDKSVEGFDRVIRQEIRSVAEALETYKKEKGHYPKSLVEMNKPWMLEGLPESFVGCPFQYQVSGDGEGFTLISSGIDNEFGTIDDIAGNLPD
ncbi:MAG: type II secretion system protein GspG [Candidatus Omnitrophota bacterium]|nr:type II secretion system protein GspG [Candidatus Omnitrophota bacterium]MDZ4241799.1 type II secretion system protein GspG [Candidatus Omnitrophota bacterium]